MPNSERAYVVAAYGGKNTSGDPNAVWYRNQSQAEADLKRRLGVKRLHQRARDDGGAAHEHKARRPDGSEWRCVYSRYFSAVPASHADYGRSGGFRFCWMERVTEGDR
jgi:hypothetical protein